MIVVQKERKVKKLCYVLFVVVISLVAPTLMKEELLTMKEPHAIWRMSQQQHVVVFTLMLLPLEVMRGNERQLLLLQLLLESKRKPKTIFAQWNSYAQREQICT